MDPRERADVALARARARGAFVVTPESAVSPMDAANTLQIPKIMVAENDHRRSGEPHLVVSASEVVRDNVPAIAQDAPTGVVDPPGARARLQAAERADEEDDMPEAHGVPTVPTPVQLPAPMPTPTPRPTDEPVAQPSTLAGAALFAEHSPEPAEPIEVEGIVPTTKRAPRGGGLSQRLDG